MLPDEQPTIKSFDFVYAMYMDKGVRVPGGVCLYARKGLKITTLEKINIWKKDYFSQLISFKNHDKVIVGFYFSPKCPKRVKEFCLESSLNSCCFEEVVIGGDYNDDKDSIILTDKGFNCVLCEPTSKHGKHGCKITE